MMRLRPDWSFSKADLAKKCSWWMQEGVPWNDGPDTTYRSGGRVVHHALAVLTNDGAVTALEDPTLQAMYDIARSWLLEESGYLAPAKGETLYPRPDGLAPRLDLRAEVAFAYDLETRTARELVDPPGERNPRWYADDALRAKHGIRESEVCGRVDLVCRGWDELGAFVEVLDWKFHFGPHFLSAEEQLKVCGLAVGRAYNIDRVRVRAMHVWDEGRPTPEELPEMGEVELDTVANWLEDLALDFVGAEAHDGPHCTKRHCPAAVVCPKTTAAVNDSEDLVPADRLARGGGRSLTRPIKTVEDAAWTLTALELVKLALAAKLGELNAFVDQIGGLPVEGGVYSGQPQPGESVDLSVPAAFEVLEQHDVELAIKKVVTWDDIKKIGGAARARAVREACKARGAIKVTPKTVYDVRKPKVEQKAS
jgi:hypothetical protein